MPGGRVRRIVGVCTTCRQDKLKCDSELTHPHPCTRCRARGLQCIIDPRFKRTPARQKLRSMENELHQLRQERGVSKGPDQGSSVSRSPPTPWSHASGPSTETSPSYALVPLNASPATYVLGIQTFTASEIDRRFGIFIQYFHPHLPLLDLDTPKDILYLHSQPLFWAVIAVTCRFEPLTGHDLLLFNADFLHLLRDVNASPPISLHSIQALMLICTWPMFVRQYQLHDISWLYYSIAVGAASYLKLNFAHKAAEYRASALGTADIQNMSRTWLAIFCVANQYATWCGVDMTLKLPAELAIIDEIIDCQTAQSTLTARAAISRVAAKHVGQVTEGMSILTHETLMEYSSADLDEVRRKFSFIWTHHLEAMLLATKLSFIAALLVAFGKLREFNGAEDNNMHPKFAQQVLMGNRLAFQIVSNFEMITQRNSTASGQYNPPQNFSVLPKAFFHIIMFTSFFLLRFSCSGRFCHEADRVASVEAVGRARDALKRCSREEGTPEGEDEPLRASQSISLLLQYQQNYTGHDQIIDDRGSGSLMWDTIRQIKAIRGGRHSAWNNTADMLYLINPAKFCETSATESSLMDDPYAFEHLDMDAVMQDFLDIGNFAGHDGGYIETSIAQIPSIISHSPSAGYS